MEIIKAIIKREEQKIKEKKIRQAKKDFHKTLKQLWPLKSNEKQN